MKKLLLVLMLAGPCFGAYTKKAVIPFAAATGSTQSGIRLVGLVSNASFATFANGGSIRNTVTIDGYTVPADFALSDDLTCNTITGGYAWSWDPGSYSSTTGLGGIIWVKVPTLPTATKNVAICYGDASVTTYQGGSFGADKEASTLSLIPFGTASVLNTTDYSGNGRNASNSGGSPVSGKIGGAVSLNQASLNVVSLADISGVGDYAVAIWAFSNYTDNHENPVFSFENYPASPRNVGLFKWKPLFDAAFEARVSDTGTNTTYTLPSINNWHYFFMVRSGTTVSLYLDGNSTPMATVTVGPGTFTMEHIRFGGHYYSGAEQEWFDGIVDNAVLVGASRSTDWNATSYNNQTNPPSAGSFADVSGGASSAAPQAVIY